MTIISGTYDGDLRCSINHKSSRSQIRTDAPKDNQGKGELFSPTDLVASALGSCMLTIIAIRAQNKSIEIKKLQFRAKKVMQKTPRKIKAIEVSILMNKEISDSDRIFLEKEALDCPVALSLDKEIEQNVSFKYM